MTTPPSAPASDHWLFLAKFLRHGTAIASLAPSSRWLARATVREIDFGRARVLVELGAGTGPITRVLAERAHPECRVVVLERDPHFADLLRERFGGLANFSVLRADCRDLVTILADLGLDRVDHIVSGLPVPSFSEAPRRDLFRAVGRVLAPEGTYRQITELPWVYWRFYRRYFRDVRFRFEPRNLPPAGAYSCRGPRAVD